jgi:hypothetical protein
MNKKLLLNVDFFLSQHSSKSNSLTKWLCLVLLFVASFANAAIITVTTTTNWSSLGATAADDIIVKNGATLTVNVTTGVCRSIQLGDASSLNGGTLVFAAGGKVTVSGIVTLGNGNRIGTLTMTDGGTLVTQGFAVSGSGASVFNSGAGTVQLTATNTLPSTVFTTFNNLTCNSGITTAGIGLTINGNLANSGGGTIDFSAMNITIGGGNNQNIAGFTTAGIVAVTKTSTSNTATLTGVVNGKDLIMRSGRLALGTFIHTITGNWEMNGGTLLANSSTLRIQGDIIGGGNFNSGTGTVELYGANQSILQPAFNNLILSGTGTKTFEGTTAIARNLSITAGVIANLKTFAHTANSLTLDSFVASSGSWGSTISPATYKNDVFFDNAASGRITISTGSCVLPTTTYTITSTNGTVCSNTVGSTIGLSGSQLGVNYQLLRGGVAVGSAVDGTGGAISLGDVNITSTYTIKATRVSTLCTAMIGGSVTVLSYSSPPSPTAIVTDATCPTSNTGAIKITNLTAPASLAFDGAKRQYVDFGSPMLSNRSSFTVEGWIKFDPAKYDDRMSLFGQNDVIEFGFEGDNLRCWTRNGGSIDMPKSVYPTDKGWHHIALVGNGTNLRLYVDGVQKYVGGNSTSNYGSSSYTAKIGYGVMDDLGTGIAFTGEVFKLGFWGRALSATEILDMSKGFVIYDASQNGLLAGYSFSEGTGTTVSGVGSVSTAAQGTLNAYGSGNTSRPVWTDPYTYSWTSASGYTSSLKDISNLLPGTYNLTTSLKTCTSFGSWEVKATAAQTITTSGIITAVCSGTQMVTLPYSKTTGNPTSYTIDWDVATNGKGLGDQANTPFVFAATGGNLNTIAIPVNLIAGTYAGIMTITNGTCSQTQAVSLTINETPTTPTQGTITKPTCAVPTGSVVLNGLPATGTWTIESNPLTISKTGTGTSTTISGLAPNSYTFTVSSTTCTSAASANVVIPGLVTNTWNGGWSNSTPTVDQNVIFNSNYTSAVGTAGNLNVCSCQINSPAKVIIESGATLSVTDFVKVDHAVGSTASLTFKDKASLYQKNDNAINTGVITYERLTKSMKDQDYVYWSSPVVGQKFSTMSLGTKSYFAFDIATNNWVGTPDNMETGRGYIIKSRNAGPFPYEQTIVFNGVPNNGALFLATPTKMNEYILVGNPYPSALSADDFLVANKDVLEGTLYFWSHITPLKYDGSKWDYASNDYATYNLTGGVTGSKGGNASGSGSDKPSGKIGAGQSFFVNAAKGGVYVTFKNSMRVAGENTQFYRSSKTNKTTALEKNRIWLNLTNTNGAFKQMLVGYIEGATNDYESIYDGLSYNANAYIDFYSINKGQQFVIQGRTLPFKETDLVPLGYSSTIAGSFSIGIDNVDGSFTDQGIYLEDKVIGAIHNLRERDYTFTTAEGTFNDRFVLRYTNKTLGTDEFELGENTVLVAVANKVIKVNAFSQTIDKVFIYDVSGKLIYKKEKVGNPTLTIENLTSSNQVLLVKVVLYNKHVETKKVIF